MEKYIDPTFLLSQLSSLWHLFVQKALTINTLLEAGVIAVGLLLASFLVRPVKKRLRRLLEKPAPVCLLKNFGDSSVDLDMRIWIGDPENGIANVSSKVRLAVWDAFQEHGVEIPFPQRDIHIMSQASAPAIS